MQYYIVANNILGGGFQFCLLQLVVDLGMRLASRWYLILDFGDSSSSPPVHGVRDVSIADRMVVFEPVALVFRVEKGSIDMWSVVLHAHEQLMVLLRRLNEKRHRSGNNEEFVISY